MISNSWRDQPRTERWVGAVTLVCCVALAVWATWPAGATGGNTTASPVYGGVDAGTTGGGGSTTGLGSSGGQGTTGATLNPGTAAGGSTSTSSSGGGDTGGTGTSTSGAGSSTSGSTGNTGMTLRATDQGVSADTITIGIGLIDLGGVSEAGFGVGLRGDEDKVAAAFTKDLSSRGVHGRKVASHVYSVDPLDNSDARAACLKATETDKVFAYVDTLSQGNASQQACISNEHKVPLITPTPLSAQFQAQAAGYQMSPIQNDNRSVKDAVLRAAQLGLFDSAKGFTKLGLLNDGCAPPVNADAKAALASVGVGADKVSEFTLDCDPNSALRQISTAVLTHKRADVSLVFHVTQFIQVQTYVSTAKAQAFHPAYMVSDFGGLTADVSVENFDREEWDGAVGITSSHTGETRVGKPLPLLLRECNKVLVANGLKPMTNVSGSDGLAAYLCETIHLFEALARLVGPELTRAGLVAALPKIGTFRGAYTDTAVFDRPGKQSGGDTVAVVTWSKDCSCYAQTQGFVPAPA